MSNYVAMPLMMLAPGLQHVMRGQGFPKYFTAVWLHRVVASLLLYWTTGETLAKGSHVHHVDLDPGNNKPSNLWVFPDKQAHEDFHAAGKVHPDTIVLAELGYSDAEFVGIWSACVNATGLERKVRGGHKAARKRPTRAAKNKSTVGTPAVPAAKGVGKRRRGTNRTGT